MGERLRNVAAIAALTGIGGAALTGCGASSESASKPDGTSLIRSIEELPLDWQNDPSVKVAGEATIAKLPDGRIVEIALFTKGTEPLAPGAPQPKPSDVTQVEVMVFPAGTDYTAISVNAEHAYLFNQGTTDNQGNFHDSWYGTSASYESSDHPQNISKGQNGYTIQTTNYDVRTILPNGNVQNYSDSQGQAERVISEMEQQALDIATAISQQGELPELPKIQPN